jgi:hypothetical protein
MIKVAEIQTSRKMAFRLKAPLNFIPTILMKIKGNVIMQMRRSYYFSKTFLWALLIVTLLFASCVRRFKFTTKVCGDKLYVENFNINPFGVDEDYLTDSMSFKIYIGKFDNEHENFSYVCSGDSIKVLKLTEVAGAEERMKRVDSIILSVSDLKMKKIPKQQPLFEFK